MVTDPGRNNQERARALWNNLRKGDQQALGELFKTHFDPLYSYGFRIIPSSDRVRDAIQEVFFQLWKYRDNLGDVSSVRAYLFISLRRELLNNKAANLRREKLDKEYISAEFDALINYEKWLEILELEQAQKQKLQKVIKELSPRQREVIYLKYYEGLTNDEICRITGLRTQSVYNLVFRAIKNLRSHLSY